MCIEIFWFIFRRLSASSLVNVCVCQIRGHEIDAHRCTPSDVDGQPHWLILLNKRLSAI